MPIKTRRLTAVGAAAALVAILAWAALSGGGDSTLRYGGAKVRGGESVERALAGLDQRGVTIGNAGSANTLHLFLSFGCDQCQQFVVARLGNVIDEFVRTGRANLRLHLLDGVGPANAPREGIDARIAAYRYVPSDRFYAFSLMTFYNLDLARGLRFFLPRLAQIASATPSFARTRASIGGLAEGRRRAATDDQLAERLMVGALPALFVQPRGEAQYIRIDDQQTSIAVALR